MARSALTAIGREALVDAWSAFWVSRVIVLVAGVAAALAWGLRDDNAANFDAGGLTRPFGAVGDDLVAPFARWDAVWFLRIAEDGYAESEPSRTAFFPLYPLLVRAGGFVLGSPLVAGILVSLACFFAALVVLHRLVALDFDRDVARLTVLLVALFPGAMWFSSVYSESLFLLLSLLSVYGARTDRWALAGLAGALAAMTRSAGVVLLVPLLWLWWRSSPRRPGALAWACAVPLGVASFSLVLALAGQSPTAPLNAQEAWSRSFAGPFAAVVDGIDAGLDGARELLDGAPAPAAAFDLRWLNVGLAGVLLLTFVAVVGTVRRLPAAYWLYVVCALALPLSYPVEDHPLMSLPRFLAVLWPLHLWLAVVLARRGGAARAVALGACAVGLAFVSAKVATWGWIA